MGAQNSNAHSVLLQSYWNVCVSFRWCCCCCCCLFARVARLALSCRIELLCNWPHLWPFSSSSSYSFTHFFFSLSSGNTLLPYWEKIHFGVCDVMFSLLPTASADAGHHCRRNSGQSVPIGSTGHTDCRLWAQLCIAHSNHLIIIRLPCGRIDVCVCVCVCVMCLLTDTAGSALHRKIGTISPPLLLLLLLLVFSCSTCVQRPLVNLSFSA